MYDADDDGAVTFDEFMKAIESFAGIESEADKCRCEALLSLRLQQLHAWAAVRCCWQPAACMCSCKAPCSQQAFSTCSCFHPKAPACNHSHRPLTCKAQHAMWTVHS